MGQDFTLEFWMRPQSTLSTQFGAQVVSKTSSSQEISVLADLSSDSVGSLSVTLGPVGETMPQFLSVNLAQPKAWNHVAIVQSGFSARVYINGIDVNGSLTLVNPVTLDGTTPFVFGNGFRGQIDDIRIYRTARTGAEILADLAAPAFAPHEAALVAYYPCDEGMGTALVDDVRGSFFSAYASGINWSPGRSPGAWHLAEGDYRLANDGTSLLLELGGTEGTTLYDQIFVRNGAATLDGIVNLMFIGAYTGPVSGAWHTFDLIWAQNGIVFGDNYRLNFNETGYTVDTAVVEKNGGQLWQAIVREVVTAADMEQAARMAKPALGVTRSPGPRGTTEITYTYTRVAGGSYVNGSYVAGGIRYELQMSSDLRSWSPAAVTEVAKVSAGTGREHATVRVSSGSSKGFLRLKVSD
jgi:hypothetical protein